jgi:Cytochrome c7 and related cytochrome c/Class III cytochrome C family
MGLLPNSYQSWARGCTRFSWRAALLIGLAISIAGAAQPIAFPHDKHVTLGMACLDCHIGADQRAAATLPSVRKCMFCHAKLMRDKPEVQKVIAYSNKKVEIPWVRVYGFSPDAHVHFRHAPHYQAGIACITCHGDLTKAGVAERTVTHNMGTCLSCHRQKNASEDCAACHY